MGCCSPKKQRIWIFSIGTVLLVLGIIIMPISQTVIWSLIYKALPLTPDSLTFEKWAITPIPVYLYMYLFNWTNPEEVASNRAKPIFREVGPYVFREVKTKEDIIWHENKTVTFFGKRTWFFEPEMSGGTAEDNVTVPHLPSIAASNVVRDSPKLIKFFFNNALNKNGGGLYKTHTAMEWLFDGFYDEFLDYAMQLNNSMTGSIETNEFAWFLNRNGSKEFEGAFTIHTGQGDLTQMGEIKFWKGQNHTGFYEGDCGKLNGSTSDLFEPKRDTNEFITIFITDTCRIINLEPTGEIIELEGIKGYKFETTPNTFDNGQLNSDMQCYCPDPNNCPKTGATDLAPCAEGAPMWMSHAHFMHADPSYANTIIGMNPNYERDNFFIIMEPKLGIPLQVNAAVQVSLLIRPDDDIDILKNVPEFFAPLFITASRAVINEELADEVKFVLNLPGIIFYVGLGLFVAGLILIFIGILVVIKQNRREQFSEPNTEISDY